jgi:4-diphosphocytidyl-2-C-methyl-D-erythritol kinase
MRIKSFAKINLGLEIVGRRPDGYHDLRTLFQWLDLHDEMDLRETDGPGLTLSGDDPEVPWDETNLIVRAGRLLQSRTGTVRGAAIRVNKRIPAGRGMAGGSSNAAMALYGLNLLWALGLDRAALAGLGRTLGADVPFFFTGGLCLGEGIGDLLTPLPDLAPRFCVLAFPPFPISTARIYGALEASALTSDPRAGRISRFFETGKIDSLENDLEGTIFRFYPQLQEIKRFFKDQGAELSLVTGSGSAVYGLFADRDAADRCLRAAAGRWTAVPAETLSRERGWQDIEAGVSPSGKAAGFGPAIRGFESSRPSLPTHTDDESMKERK